MGRTGFLVMAHTDPAQLERLIRRLAPHPVFVHLDERSDRASFAACFAYEHVRVLTGTLNWAGFSMVEATMRMIEAALADGDCTYLVHLTGQCYPIRPIAELDGFLQSSGRDHIHYLPIDARIPHVQKMVQWRWFFDWEQYPLGKWARRAARVGCTAVLPDRGGPPGGRVPHWGSAYWALSRECATHVLDVYRTEPALVAFYRRAFASDEQFVHTIVANSTFAHADHLIAPQGFSTLANCPLHVVNTLPEVPGREWQVGVLDAGVDVEALRRSDKFLVRKVSSDAAERIDGELLDATPEGPPASTPRRLPGLCVFTEDRFGTTTDGLPAAMDGARGSAAWAAFQSSGQPVHVAARTTLERGTATTTLGSVAVVPLPYYVGLRGLLRRWPALVPAVFRTVRDAETIVLRVPGVITSVAAVSCRVLGRRYAVDVVGDAMDAVGSSRLGGRVPLLRTLIGRHVRWIVRNASSARYVTAHALQQRYPAAPGRPAVGVSDVRLAGGVVPAPRQRGEGARLVTVGTMEASYKGQDDLIRAVATLHRAGMDVTADLVGGGRLQPQLEALATELGVAAQIRFRGVIADRAELNAILDEADVFVLASRQEGLPRALVEAMARALPAVATRVGGVPELLDGDVLVEPNAVEPLASTIRRLLEDSAAWEHQSARNLSTAGQYSESVLTERFREWLVQIPSARRPVQELVNHD
ncbi:MAG: glycosyltransferase [Sporichthyaceae bacterium]